MRDLRQLLVGLTIQSAEVYWERSIATPSPEQFKAGLAGQRVRGVARRGKFVILRLEHGDLLVHLRMTGQLLAVPAGEGAGLRHLRVALTLDGRRLLFNDPRKFGRLYLVPAAETALAGLGPEPLGSDFTEERLATCLQGRRGAIKALLLDQRFLAGVGNIYADEALHAAGIAPQRQACSLSRSEIGALHRGIREELERGIRHRGTTISDYRDAEGRAGEHAEHLCVYGRAGRPCLRCGTAIVRQRIGGRSSFHCPRCQR